MTIDELFEQLKIADTEETVKSFNDNTLASFRRKFICDKISQRVNERHMEDFYKTMNGDLYDKYKNDGVSYIVHSYFQDNEKSAFLKKTFQEIFTKDEQNLILSEVENVTLENIEHVNLAPKELDDAILKANSADKEFLQEIKNVVFKSIASNFKDYYTELIKRIEHIKLNQGIELIKKSKDDSKDEFAREANKILFDANGKDTVSTILFDPQKHLNARKKVFDYMMNAERIKGNSPEDKKILKQVIQILNDRLYDGQELNGEEGTKVYSARRFYDSFIRIQNLCKEKEIDVETLRQEYDKYKQYKNEYEDVVNEVSKILKGKGFAGNMDLSRTNCMPDSFVKNFETITVMNGIWVLMGYIKQSNLSVDEFLENPFINTTKLLCEEKAIDYNKIFSKDDLESALKKAITFKMDRPLNFYSNARSLTNCFMLNETNPGPKIYDKIYPELLGTISHGYDFSTPESVKAMANLYLLGHPSDEIDYNFLFCFNYVNYDKLEIIKNDTKSKMQSIMNLESKKHVTLGEIKDRLGVLKNTFIGTAHSLSDLGPIYNMYLDKYLKDFDKNMIEEAAKLKAYVASSNYIDDLSAKNIVETLAKNANTVANFKVLLDYAKAYAFKESPEDTISIAQVLRNAYDELDSKDDLEPLMNEFELKANGEILFTAFNNEAEANYQKELFNNDIKFLDELLKKRNFGISNELLKGIVLSKKIESENRAEALENELNNVAGAFEEKNYNQYLERYYNYVNNDIRELSSNASDIRKALVMKDAYTNISLIKNNYLDFLSDKIKSKAEKNRFNMSMYKMYEYQKLLNDNFEDLDILKDMLQNKPRDAKLTSKYSAIYGKDKHLAEKTALDFFDEIVALNTNYAGDIRLKESGFKGIDKLEFRLFIGGKSVNEICKEKYPNKSVNEAKAQVLLNALLNPKKPIELANYNNDYEVKTIKIDFTEAKLNSNYYSKARRLFKGIAPIRPNHTYEKVLEAADFEKADRQKNIKTKFMEYALASKMQKIQDEARKSISIPKEFLTSSRKISVDINNNLEKNKDLTK